MVKDNMEMLTEADQAKRMFVDNGKSPEKTPTLSYEDILRSFGHIGKFQYIQCALTMLPLLHVCYSTLGFVIEGFTPPHRCSQINETELLSSYSLLNDSTAMVTYGQCDVTLTSNYTGNLTHEVTLACPNGRHFPQGRDMTIVSHWDLVCEKMGVAETAFLLFGIGGIVGGLILPALADRVGRKMLLCVSTIVMMVVDICTVFSPNFYMFCTGLSLNGFVSVGIFSIFPIIAMENLLCRHRTIYGILYFQFWVLGILLIGCFGYVFEGLGWRYFHASGAFMGLFSLALPFYLCESPRWLLINGRPKEALAVLKKASEQNGKDFGEVKKIFDLYMNQITSRKQQEHSDENKEDTFTRSNGGAMPRYTLLNMLTRKKPATMLLIMWFLWFTNILIYYGLFLSSSDLAGNRYLNFCLIGLIEIPSNFTNMYVMDKMKRLTSLRLFLASAAICLMGSVLFNQFAYEVAYSDVGTIILFILGKFAINCSYNVLLIITPELFPTVLRASGLGSCRSIPGIGLMLASYSRPLYALAKWAPNTIFSGMSVIAIFLTFFLTEMKDRDLPTEIQDLEIKNEFEEKDDFNLV